jgi:murein DD-endopeptidase MepM/ murein hydrolase activator NlpD
MKEDRHLRELEPETFPDRRIKLIVDNMGSRHSLALRPWILFTALAVLMAGILALVFLAFRQPGAENTQCMAKLETENKYLVEELGRINAELDSINAAMDTLGIEEPVLNEAYPYYSPDADESINKLQIHPGLEQQLALANDKLDNIKKRLDSVLEGAGNSFIPPDGFDRHGDGIPSIFPTFGEITSDWGMRIHPILNDYRFHQGMDIANKTGTPVYATADGVVSRVRSENGYGKVITIDHIDGYMTLYGHLYGFKVKAGDVVRKGQIIGLMGNTGMSTGSHLHYGVYRAQDPLNPSYYLNRIDTSLYTVAGR